MKLKALSDKIKQDKKILIPALLGALGLVMLLISSSFSAESSEKKEIDEQTPVSGVTVSVSDVEQALENKLEAMIGGVKGAGSAKVMVTLLSSGEYVYAENTKDEKSDNKQSLDSEIVIYEASDGSDSGLVISVKSPEILGVAVICDGGGSAVVRSEIKSMVTSLFGITSDRVYVGTKSTE